ncbi:MAG: ABC transporter ATP-binding protein [Clostridia bacterium]|nr:ABC transporter ATP-binding protein [Clostridia bacterium]
MELISCVNLSVGYEGRRLVSGISFRVCEGDYLCILGPNGAGKTTLMKTILGLLPPVAGLVSYGDGFSARQIGYLPQQSLVQRDFPASVREIVLSGCTGRMGFRIFYGKEEKKRADSAMNALGIASLKDRCYRELSGGQQQRVLIARALCATEKVILLDEPAAGLDPQATDELYKTLAALNREQGTAIIMISHDIGAAKRYASHVLYVGDNPFFGSAAEYAALESLSAGPGLQTAGSASSAHKGVKRNA